MLKFPPQERPPLQTRRLDRNRTRRRGSSDLIHVVAAATAAAAAFATILSVFSACSIHERSDGRGVVGFVAWMESSSKTVVPVSAISMRKTPSPQPSTPLLSSYIPSSLRRSWHAGRRLWRTSAQRRRQRRLERQRQRQGDVEDDELGELSSTSTSASLDEDTEDDDVSDEESSWYDLTFRPRPRRRPIVAGNWKLNPGTLGEAEELLKLIRSNFDCHRGSEKEDDLYGLNDFPEVVVFPPAPFLARAVELLDGTAIKVGCQNVGSETSGAFTGEIAPSMVRSLGCDYVMVGHSERRTLFEETDAQINAKIKACLVEGPTLSIILCIGETEEEYDSDLLRSVVDSQLKRGLKEVTAEEVTERIVIAYEPVWAIGTGKVATPEQAQAAHVAIRRTLTAMYGREVARRVRIQYGGSVKPDSIVNLMAQPDVDGALVGGASLSADSFTRIVDGATPSSDTVAQGTLPNENGNDANMQASLNVVMSPLEFSAMECVATRNVLGESAVWSVRDQALYWISAPEGEVWTWNLRDAPYRQLMDSTLGCVALLSSSKKNGRETGHVVVAAERALLETTLSPPLAASKTISMDGGNLPTVLCARPEADRTTRPNDGRVDRQGRLVLGMYNNYHRGGGPSVGENNAGLYRLNRDLQAQPLFPDDYQYRCSNCICFSPGRGDTLYFCDTPTRKIYAFDYPVQDEEEGNDAPRVSNRRLVWTMPPEWPGGPDGAQVDEAGGLWVAVSGAGRVVRIDPSKGQITTVVHVPVPQPTSVTIGGPDLDELFITTRSPPGGGGLYRWKLPPGMPRGLPEREFIVAAGRQATAKPRVTATAIANITNDGSSQSKISSLQPAGRLRLRNPFGRKGGDRLAKALKQ